MRKKTELELLADIHRLTGLCGRSDWPTMSSGALWKVIFRDIRDLADAGMALGGERQITIGRWKWRGWHSYHRIPWWRLWYSDLLWALRRLGVRR